VIDTLRDLRASRNAGRPLGIVSVCSAHPLVIEAALLEARDRQGLALIEATCNQVNQEGGYTGMTPADFRARVFAIGERIGLPQGRILLGGDHLGPNPWIRLPAAEAMARAETMVAHYVRAGFTKIHLDCSMRVAGDPERLSDAEIAERAARLCAVAEAAAGADKPFYVIGTEVPPPGGAGADDHTIAVTPPAEVAETVGLHQRAFARLGLEAAFERVIGVVEQPGVEFGSSKVHFYDPAAARALPQALEDLPGLVFEAHSTDYQTADALTALVADGFAILKVGPWLTFALREALYGLDSIARAMGHAKKPLPEVMEALMLARPGAWQSHYAGSERDLRLARHFSYSDRIRYYWDEPGACAAVEELIKALPAAPETLVSQYLPPLYDAVRCGQLPADARSLAIAAVRRVLALYWDASGA
jgi:D-tagatose 6-phosphate 4-epimerase